MLGSPTPIRSAAELADASRSAYRDGMTATEYVARRRAIEDEAAVAIRAYAKVFSVTAHTALMRIAAKLNDSPESDLCAALAEVFDLSDPDDVAHAFDEADKALSAFRETYWTGE